MNAVTLAVCPPDSDISNASIARHLRAGLDHHNAGRIDEAISAYQRGLHEAEGHSSDGVPIESVAELHSRLGDAGMIRGDLELAAVNYKAALRIAPDRVSCWCNLGTVYLRRGAPLEAISLYAQALALNPVHWPSRSNSVYALMATGQHLLAHALLTEMIEERPQDATLHNQLGKLHFELNDPAMALTCFEQAAVLNPDDFDSIYWIGGLKQQAGDAVAAEAAYARAARLQPLIRRPAAKFPAEFRVLALFAPFAGNTPTETLFKDAAYDTDTLALSANQEPDIERLGKPDVIVNLVSDADQAATVLPVAAGLVAQLRKPTVNDPGRIQKTTREATARLLGDIAGCRIPRVIRREAGAVKPDVDFSAALSYPILARPVGTHGGDDFDKMESAEDLAALLTQHPETAHYLIEYIDYRSTDGYFRKYRFIFVDGQILPYHLAINDDWKVHHDSTDMEHHPWMQLEEAGFLSDPAATFNAEHYRALREIQRAIGLDFFGIDCGLDRSGNLVVFEVNASMLIHEGNETFPYKNPFVARVKHAFDEMLRKLAARAA